MAIVRDEVCANRVGLLAEMGAMEEELLVFGCCYLENGQVKYRVSSDKDEISLFQLDAVDVMVFPTPMQELSWRQLIPSGERDDVLYEIKKKLAQGMQRMYPDKYFTLLRPFAERMPVNTAWPLLQQLQERLEGHFEADELHLYERMLGLCSQKKLLDEAHKEQGRLWLAKNRNQMEDDVVVKERNERTFYGFVYYTQSNVCCTKMNMALDRVLAARMQLEHEGALVGPVLTKTFWFAESSQLAELRGMFDQWLRQVNGQEMYALLKQLSGLPAAVDVAAYQTMLQQTDDLPMESRWALEWYARVWNVKI